MGDFTQNEISKSQLETFRSVPCQPPAQQTRAPLPALPSRSEGGKLPRGVGSFGPRRGHPPCLDSGARSSRTAASATPRGWPESGLDCFQSPALPIPGKRLFCLALLPRSRGETRLHSRTAGRAQRERLEADQSPSRCRAKAELNIKGAREHPGLSPAPGVNVV